jgi:inner membrane transporter RhtA
VLGWALFICSGTGSAVAAALATKTFDEVPPVTGSAFSFTVAGLLMVGAVRPRTAGWSAGRWHDSARLGGIALVNVIVLYLALERLPLGTAITIEFLGPLGLAVLHAKAWRDYAAAALAIGGVAVVTGASVSTDSLGLALALSAAACWAFYIVAARRVGARGRPTDGLAVAIGIGGLVGLPLAVVACFQFQTVGVVALLVAVALLGRILPYTSEIVALRLLTPGSAGVLFSVVPVIAALVGFLLLDEPYSLVQVAGVAIVVVASALVLSDAPPE